ncbi:hypothetical protein NNJEOMEG_00629 [Fundidesulfovibrio magnetotacticus]|uniref:Uncharacterized protein n=1 Tax=Fundidesulfovibrio magnetotacticus TaxID=2730080 RepID=A0A6V8LJ87_9BACT|nr:hypothetical protein [Fundidesulfovibrio magnetotacticus]GFK92802.1 hypothetical protein NNJEOMEG_00629 [Fundidesulfovibrio magnetotacticus]
MGKVSNSTKAARSLVEHAKAYFAVASANTMQLQAMKSELNAVLMDLEIVTERLSELESKVEMNLQGAMVMKEALRQVVEAAQSEKSGERS